METTCPKCRSPMEAGVGSARGLMGSIVVASDEPRLVFVVPGAPVSVNPVKAFAQGLADEPSEQAYLVRGHRCTRCGFLELFAMERTRPPGT